MQARNTRHRNTIEYACLTHIRNNQIPWLRSSIVTWWASCRTSILWRQLFCSERVAPTTSLIARIVCHGATQSWRTQIHITYRKSAKCDKTPQTAPKLSPKHIKKTHGNVSPNWFGNGSATEPAACSAQPIIPVGTMPIFWRIKFHRNAWVTTLITAAPKTHDAM